MITSPAQIELHRHRTVGALLAKLRTAGGVSQSALAARLNMTQSHVSKVEAGARRVDLGEFYDWLTVLNVDPAEAAASLFGGWATSGQLADDAQLLLDAATAEELQNGC